jgi:hypothetical protein
MHFHIPVLVVQFENMNSEDWVLQYELGVFIQIALLNRTFEYGEKNIQTSKKVPSIVQQNVHFGLLCLSMVLWTQYS